MALRVTTKHENGCHFLKQCDIFRTMKKEILDLAEKWASDTCFDNDTRQEIRDLIDSGDHKELNDRFYKSLDFGTGGLRGVMAAGLNRMNIYTLRRAAQGLANYIINYDNARERGVVIGYDSRNNSRRFAEETACVLAANGIKSLLFQSPRPTPEVSFSILHRNAIAGVVITASHNPPEYNGFKVFSSEGQQITPPHDQNIINKVNEIDDISSIKPIPYNLAVDKGYIEIQGAEEDEAYLKEISKQSIRKAEDNIKIVYSPLHGSGNIPVRTILKKIGFSQVYIVKEQMEPDGDFPTVQSPNPEESSSFELALEYGRLHNADIILATDPDADRIGAAVKDHKDEFYLLNGNQLGALLTDYILTALSERGRIDKSKAAVIKTIVTTDMIKDICSCFEVECIELLTGFKYIGEWINRNPDRDFLFGCEESYGYLRGSYARDKDAVLAASLICEMTSYYKAKDITLYDGLMSIYKKYGCYMESLVSLTKKGVEGAGKIREIMEVLKNDFSTPFTERELTETRDYNKGIAGLPKSSVLSFIFSDNTKITVRPSGTEPKIKIYFSTKGKTFEQTTAALREIEKKFIDMIGGI